MPKSVECRALNEKYLVIKEKKIRRKNNHFYDSLSLKNYYKIIPGLSFFDVLNLLKEISETKHLIAATVADSHFKKNNSSE